MDRYIVTMPDGSKWAIPTIIIAYNRADAYKGEFDGDVMRSLTEDTLPLFQGDPYEIEDWARNNMDWEDVSGHAVLQEKRNPVVDYQEGWVNGEVEIV